MSTIIIRLAILAIACFLVACKAQSPTKASSANELIERIKSGDFEIVRLTVDSNKSLANTKRSDGVPLMHFAASNGHKDIVSYLLDMGADIDNSTEYGTALHAAVDNEYEEIVQLLLNRGADPNFQNHWKMTPLHETGQNKKQTNAKLLIDYGADINARDYKGRTPLHRCKSLKIAKLLISKGADVNAVDNSGYTPLHWAGTPREIVDRPTIEYLLANGADTSLTDNLGLTPRQLAIKNSQIDLISILDAHER